ncbi:ATP-binding protein [Flavobacterium sp. W21_SRS_FM6]|uniref:ATP-binding protein n=1 Tax=Flavobacterium sp. W21_SRS_FM6 TaxID=3240268 RepID=UPI003F92A6C1
MKLDINKLNFDKCENEKIHIPESIQAYGYLFALDNQDGKIKIISENVKDLLKDGDILDSNFFDLIDDNKKDYDFFKETYQRARKQQTRLPIQVKFKSNLMKFDLTSEFYAVVYDSGNYFVVELEPASEFRTTYSAIHHMKLYAKTVAPKFEEFKTLDEIAQHIVTTIKFITKMERVVLYKFNDDESGQVIAEAKVDDIDSYLGLFYPASDIPKQARELYKKNWVRIAPDVDMAASLLISSTSEDSRAPLDMTYSILRSMSPIHLQYIRNQGLRASMSVSLVTHNKLWGLISCHSRQSCYIPQNIRLECENISQLFSWHLYAKEEEIQINKRNAAESKVNAMLDMVTIDNSIIDVFNSQEEEILGIMEADGFIFYSEQETVSLGIVPELNVIHQLIAEFDSGQDKIYISNNVTKTIEDRKRLNGIRGVMLIPLGLQKGYYTAWFRKEHRQIEKWVGAADEKQATSSKQERLTPRADFRVYDREVTDQSIKWDQSDTEVAGRFNRVFMAHALEMQERMRVRLIQMSVQDEYRNDFLATLAHELRNPLAPISSGIEVLRSSPNMQVMEKVLTTIERQVKNMTVMVNDLMEISRITKGKLKIEKHPMSIQHVVKDALESCERLVIGKQHNLKSDLITTDCFVRGDRTRLEQVFTNIINNSIKYTPEGGNISVEMEANDSHVVIKIIDDGIGIPLDKIQEIFTMFTQVESESKHSKSGLGIGLTLVKSLVELHEGEIIVRSDGLNQGCEVEVKLPIITAIDDLQNLPKVKSTNSNMRKNRVMIVDDSVDILGMYKILLEQSGYIVETVSNPTQATSVFQLFCPDFVFLDIGMPQLDGYTLCGLLSRLPEASHTKFICQSGWGTKSDVQKAYDAGFIKHLVKPVNRQKLEDTLKELQDSD